ncbi:MAG: hypothetical protein Q9227_008880 [Pyrenula ochraceoflavens]
MPRLTDLPGELRNRVYEFIFPEHEFREIFIKRLQKRPGWTYYEASYQLLHFKAPLSRYDQIKSIRGDWRERGNVTTNGMSDDGIWEEMYRTQTSKLRRLNTKSILQVCRLIRAEATAYMYGTIKGSCIFIFSSTLDMTEYLACLEPATRSHIQNVGVCVQRAFDTQATSSVYALLQTLSSAREQLVHLRSVKIYVTVEDRKKFEDLLPRFDEFTLWHRDQVPGNVSRIPDEVTLSFHTFTCHACERGFGRHLETQGHGYRRWDYNIGRGNREKAKKASETSRWLERLLNRPNLTRIGTASAF